jgi:FkbM family methyltransferase
MKNSLAIRAMQYFTLRVQLKGVPKILWYIRKFFMKKNSIYNVYKNIQLKIDNETKFHWLNIFHYDGYETILLLEKYLNPGDTYIDIGANYGYMSINADRLVGSGGLVIAIEPEPRVRDLLKFNTKLNKSRIMIVDKAISDCVGEANFNVATEIGLSRLDNAKNNTFGMDLNNKVTVQKTTLDMIASDFVHDRNIKFVKVDVEGHELNILNGALNLIAKNKTIFMLEINHGALSQSDLGFKDIFEFFVERSYKVFWIYSHSADWFRIGRNPSLMEVKNYNELENIYADIIAIPNELNV